MKQNSLEHRVRRRSEISEFMGADLDTLLEQEAKQAAARMACNAILWHVVKNRASAGDIRGR
ncbi:hypothetical protein [Paraburkholderia saeva]|uniref:Uncharacterized protein n=1 Tax=Paraburkholderia saeva TaxID=2777537 RepID=A0A9N8RXX3_9BURK|nr:hypothetical protein [Paraburkholderia saeva]CAG4900713.1 hypothetical protein LMG31841_02909 [Paraburkholderia saeva]